MMTSMLLPNMKTIKTLLTTLAATLLMAGSVYAINITVPSASTSDYYLRSKSTGAYTPVLFLTSFSGDAPLIATTSTSTTIIFPKNLAAFTNDAGFSTSTGSSLSGTQFYFPYYASSSALSATSSLYYGASNRLFVLSPVDGSEVARFDPADAFQLGTTIPLKFSKDGSAISPSLTWTANIGGGTGLYKPATSNIGLSTDGVERIRILDTGFVGIGTSSPATLLDVNGTSTLRNALILPFITSSILGVDSSGKVIATTTSGGSGTVTSVALTVPTGLTATGTPITASGTLGISLTSGYIIPLSASTTDWQTAFNWGNHALAGYLATTSGNWGGTWQLYNPIDFLSSSTSYVASESDPVWTAASSSYATSGQVLSGGVANYIPKWLSATTQGTSTMYESSGNVGIGTTTPATLLDVYGSSTVLSLYTDTIYNLLGNLRFDLASGLLKNVSGFTLIDLDNGYIYDPTQTYVVIDLATGVIKDPVSGNERINLANGTLSGSDGVHIDYDAQKLLTGSNANPLSWNDDGASTTNININETATATTFCLVGDSCITSWPTSGGGGATTTINGASGPTFTFLASSSGTNFNIASTTGTITFNLPTSSASATGKLSSADWSIFNAKQNAISFPLAVASTSLTGGAGLVLTGDDLAVGAGTNIVVNANDIQTTLTPTFTTLSTGQGQYELYKMDQDVHTTSTPTFASLISSGNVTSTTVNTGQGQNELYAMDQEVKTTSSVTFNSVAFGESPTDMTPNANGGVNGRVSTTTNAGATTTAYQIVYLDSNSTWLQTDADASTTSKGHLAVALEAKNTGQAVKVALDGAYIRNDAWGWATGTPLYLSTDLGAATSTAPSGASDVLRVIGYAVTPDIINFSPSEDWVSF